jgi:hypothetical protein
MGTLFFSFRQYGLQIFVSASRDIPDVAAPSRGRWFDVRDDFGACVPLVMFLKWAFRDVGWQPRESGACLIIDDPLLRHRYGFFDFGLLERLMRERRFTTNIAFIPWNVRRTSLAIAKVIVASEGRFSISTHGCDHTGAEFGVKSIVLLNAKLSLTKQRMEQHFQRTGVQHECIMVFPQGVFSAASLRALQQNQFLAAVNTEVLSVDGDQDGPALADLWGTALLSYASFPLFTRRYPGLGLENFAFDILLGKPCLIVEHHTFFRDGGVRAAEFIDALNALNVHLEWQPLGKVIRRAYQWRRVASDVLHIRMFANELELRNEDAGERTYVIEKSDHRSVGVQAVLTDRGPVAWKRDADRIVTTVQLRPGDETRVRVLYAPPAEAAAYRCSPLEVVQTAVRRYGSEFRDNVLSHYEGLSALTAFARSIVRKR